MRVVLLCALAACSSPRSEAAPRHQEPALVLTPVTDLCVTKGELEGATVEDPTMRGYARGAGGDAAELTFTYRGETFETRELAGGDARRQIGVKLRAQDSCNVVYVMWRLDPRPKLDVSVKFNPRMTAHEQCGADGYTKVRPVRKPYVPAFEVGGTHKLRAEISGDDLFVWIDGKQLWQGRLPETARMISGPAGVRSDNVKFDLVELAAPRGAGKQPPCKRE